MTATTHRRKGRTSRRLCSILATTGLGAGLFAGLGATAQAAATSCRAADPSTGARSTHLQVIIDSASPGDTINIKGVCAGNFVIDKDLRLVGKATASVPQATLDGRADGMSVVLVNSTGRRLVIRDLLITNGHATFGGGIQASGPVTLLGSASVSGNTADNLGGGIQGASTVFLRDTAKVDNNTAITGGGIFTYGALVMSGTSEVNGNTATGDSGGGVQATSATLRDHALVSGNKATGSDISEGGGLAIGRSVTLAGSSRVTGNQADFGGGVFTNRAIKLEDQASVTGNTAVTHGGIFGHSISACDNTGLDEWTGAISPNTPDDPPAVTPVSC